MVLKNKQQPIIRDFYGELKDITWKPITYGLFNKLDDDGFIPYIQNMNKEVYAIEDLEYCTFTLTDKEKFLITIHNKEYLKNVQTLISKVESILGVTVCIDYKKGVLQLVKLVTIKFD